MSSYSMKINHNSINSAEDTKRKMKKAWGIVLSFMIAYCANISISWNVKAKEKTTSALIAEQALQESLNFDTVSPGNLSNLDRSGIGLSKTQDKKNSRLPAQTHSPQSANRQPNQGVSRILSRGGEVVIVLTEQGFVPQKLMLERGKIYDVYLVNINEKMKLSSFFIDEFGVQGSLPHAQMRKISLTPKVSGEFFILSPESGALVQILVAEEH